MKSAEVSGRKKQPKKVILRKPRGRPIRLHSVGIKLNIIFVNIKSCTMKFSNCIKNKLKNMSQTICRT